MTNLEVEEVAKVLFHSRWPTSTWGETGLELTFRYTAQKAIEKLDELRNK
jgi:hypothetical protein